MRRPSRSKPGPTKSRSSGSASDIAVGQDSSCIHQYMRLFAKADAPDMLPPMTLSVCIITLNEEVNIARTIDSVRAIADEIIVVDSGSTDKTVVLAEARGAKVFHETWKGFAPQKNSALAKATCDWVLSLDADEEVSPELAASIQAMLKSPQPPQFSGYKMNRRNMYLA